MSSTLALALAAAGLVRCGVLLRRRAALSGLLCGFAELSVFGLLGLGV